MNFYLLLIGIVIFICILANRYLEKTAVPSLVFFIFLGMCFGENGVFRIPFDDYVISEAICSISLIFIMFYGGFGTSLKAAKPVIVRSAILSSMGVILTAGITGGFVYFVLHRPLLESLLIGAVISSTDAATVFHILRSKKMALKYHTDSMLELESGSNDPISYMMTTILVALMTGESISIPVMFAKQIFLGVLVGIVAAKLAVYLLQHVSFHVEHEKTVLVFSVAIVSYAFAYQIGGNGYLSVYLCGILMGNASLTDKKYLVHFFDVITNAAQVTIFFLLGLLVTPKELPEVLIPAFGIMVFLTLIARPISVFLLLKPFKAPMKQIGVVSWAGLRGVASIVFSIYAVLQDAPLKDNLFNLVFCIVIMSILIQGTLLPSVCRRLDMLDQGADIRKTFNDYQEESDICFVKMHIEENHPWINKQLKEIEISKELLIVLVIRDEKTIVPDGMTKIQKGDLVVLAALEFEDRENIALKEIILTENHRWIGQTLGEITLPPGCLVIMIKRDKDTIIPRGDTKMQEDDVLVVAKQPPVLETKSTA
ncbi:MULTISPECIES: potassium/proton antiporter [Sellimonas]|uniref:Potassium/proton antiporter n=1 Tax=Sellimonas caecigallum TaxID=2592333 RepID=A0ABS7L750_9FIRM|nr:MULTISPECIES: potassium/proton antiporter [Sellimonas]MBY0758919.1 potassium/proton antiporter [Sellimonas caecigallum]OUP66238.1 K+/H+ antiporter [Drancourtella sp. An177]